MLRRSRSALAAYEAHHGPNMTPMVDVVMVILIFFMASTVVLGPEWFIRSGLPKKGAPSAAAPTPEQRLRITLTRSATNTTLVSIDSGPAQSPADTLRLLRERVPTAEAAATTTLLIDAADSIPYDDVVTIHEAAAAAGITKIGIMPPATSPAAPPPAPK